MPVIRDQSFIIHLISMGYYGVIIFKVLVFKGNYSYFTWLLINGSRVRIPEGAPERRNHRKLITALCRLFFVMSWEIILVETKANHILKGLGERAVKILKKM